MRPSPPITPPTIGPIRLFLSDDELSLLLARAGGLVVLDPDWFAVEDGDEMVREVEAEEVGEDIDVDGDETADEDELSEETVVDALLVVLATAELGAVVGVAKANKCSVTSILPQAI